MQPKTILQTIGNTPLVELEGYSHNKNVKIFAKLEGNNPGGSIKDRIALYMMKDAIKRGILSKDKEILEATSGNTGIGIAMLSVIFGYQFTAVMPESVSSERKKLLTTYGAKIIYTDGDKGTNYSIEVAKNLKKENPDKYIILDQFENKSNPLAHYETTGKEIIDDIPEITHFIAGMGSGGTLMGVGKRIRELNPNIKVIGIEPKAGTKIQGLRNMSAYNPPIYDKSFLDEKLDILDDEEAFDLARHLLKKSGVSAGLSSGAALWGAIELSKSIKDGNIVTIFPDRIDRYASTSLLTD